MHLWADGLGWVGVLGVPVTWVFRRGCIRPLVVRSLLRYME